MAKLAEPEPSLEQLPIGELLRQLRKQSGRTQYQQAKVLCELANRDTVDHHVISRWEREYRIPMMPWQKFIAKSFGVPVALIKNAAAKALSEKRQLSMATKAAGLESGTSPGIDELLRQLRAQSGRTQPQQARVLCELAGLPLTRCEVHRWERGKRIPQMPWIQHIADSYNVPVAQLQKAATISRYRRRTTKKAPGNTP